jgi:hypothetical protein
MITNVEEEEEVHRGADCSQGTPSPSPLKRLREGQDILVPSAIQPAPQNMASKACTLGGHLDSPNDLRSILGTMLTDKQLETLCDVVLIVGDERFSAHKAVLAAASKVFKAMFTREMREKNADEIILSSIDPRSWRVAMQYIYTAQVDIDTEETALLVLGSARMYQLETLEHFVESFLISRISVCNCFEFLGHAERYDLEKLKEACEHTMEERFEEMTVCPAFLNCPVDLLTKLVQSENLVLKSETAVFDAVTRWIQADEKSRMCELDRMLQMVRVSEMDECELAVAGRNPTANCSMKFRTAVLESLLQRRTDVGGIGPLLANGSHLKARKRRDRPFTFTHLQRSISGAATGDDDEVVRTPWAPDPTGRYIWRLKIYPHGYLKAKGEYLSVYVQGRSTCKSEKLDMQARFDIFLVNRKDGGGTISFSSQHHFTTNSDHWGFHRYILLSRLTDPAEGFISEETDSVLLGANVMF